MNDGLSIEHGPIRAGLQPARANPCDHVTALGMAAGELRRDMGEPKSDSVGTGETSAGASLLPDVGVVALVPDFWATGWATRHYVMTNLARYFQVVWVDPALGWRELWLNGEGDLPDAETGGPKGLPGFTVYRSGRWLPRLYRPRALATYVAHRRVRNAVQILRRRGCRSIILYLWRPEFRFALKAVPEALSCYHIDDEYSFSEQEHPVPPEEAALISEVDQVVIHSAALMEKKGGLNPQTIQVSNGVEYETFARPTKEPVDMQAIPRPRMGYVGIVKKQLDLDLLGELARKHQDWSFVLVGPLGQLGDQTARIEELAQHKNVFLLGGKSRAELPAYMGHMDVCMLCYKMDGYTKYIYPLKLHEYLATGRPVVASPIRSLLGFRDVVKLAGTTDEWSLALGQCLSDAELSPERIEARRRVAKEHDWGSLVYKIATALSQRLGQPFYERLISLSGNRLVTSGSEPDDAL